MDEEFQEPYEADEVDTPEVSPEAFVAFVTESQNIAAEFGDAKLAEIARQVIDDHAMDRASMADWLTEMQRGLDLAQLKKADRKAYPFDGASNVKYPLITTAILQFNARAYPAIVPADQTVRAKVYGSDAGGMKAARAERISSHMSWQLAVQIEEWEADTDQLLTILPAVGTLVRKVWYDPVLGRPRLRVIEPGKFIVNDKVKSLSDAPRCSEEFSLFPPEVEANVREGQFLEVELEETQDAQGPQDFIEQHCRIDLDDDGFYEPYIVTVHVPSEKVVRIVADFEPGDVKYKRETQMVETAVQVVDPMTGGMVDVPIIQPQEVVTGILNITRNTYFVPYHFWPSLNGGFWGTGLGTLLGDISEAVDTIINMQLDAAHFAALGGGFLGSDIRLKGGAQRFRPGEWKPIPTKGMDIRQGMVPVTFGGADAVLFQMLGLLIEAGREMASVKDIMTGDTGNKNMTATTTLALIEQGMMVFTAVYKRIYRSLRSEFGLLARVNAGTVDPQAYNAFHDETDAEGQPMQHDPQQDYGATDMDIVPVADPRSVTKMQDAAKAQLIMELSGAGLLDKAEAAKRVLEAADISDTESLVPEPDPAQGQMQQMQMQAMQADLSQKMADIELTLAKVEEAKVNAMKDMSDIKSAEFRDRLDGLKTMLEASRDGIRETLAGGAGRMARQPRDAGGAGGNGAGLQGPQEFDVTGILGGQPPAGVGEVGLTGIGAVQR